MEEQMLKSLLDKLDVIARLSALGIARQIRADGGQQKEIIEALGGAGLTNAAIADLLGTTADTVKVTLYRARNHAPKKSAGSRSEGEADDTQ